MDYVQFNPIKLVQSDSLVRLFCMREDQELACDAYALTFIDKEEQIAYGHTIITLLQHYSYQVPSLANLSRNKRTLKGESL